MAQCLGFIETVGFVAMAEALDVMLKAASVELVNVDQVTGQRVAACIQGDVGAVRVAIEAGIAAASKISQTFGTVLANPSPELVNLFAPKEK